MTSLSCAGKWGQFFLVTFNIIFVLIGLSMVGVAAIFQYGGDTVHELTNKIMRSLSNNDFSLGLSGVDLENVDLAQAVEGADTGILVLGIAILIVASVGGLGAKLKMPYLLMGYAMLLCVIIVGETLFLVLVFSMRKKIDEPLKNLLKSLIRTHYVGFNSTDGVSYTLNFMMSKLNCCGVDDFSDFYKSENWQRTYVIGDNVTAAILVPVACCKLEYLQVIDLTCATAPTTINSNYRQGCYAKLWEELYKFNNYIIGVAASLGVLQILLIVCACVTGSATKRKRRNSEANDAHTLPVRRRETLWGLPFPLPPSNANDSGQTTGNSSKSRRTSGGEARRNSSNHQPMFSDVTNMLSAFALQPVPMYPMFSGFTPSADWAQARDTSVHPGTSPLPIMPVTRLPSGAQGHMFGCNLNREQSGYGLGFPSMYQSTDEQFICAHATGKERLPGCSDLRTEAKPPPYQEDESQAMPTTVQSPNEATKNLDLEKASCMGKGGNLAQTTEQLQGQQLKLKRETIAERRKKLHQSREVSTAERKDKSLDENIDQGRLLCSSGGRSKSTSDSDAGCSSVESRDGDRVDGDGDDPEEKENGGGSEGTPDDEDGSGSVVAKGDIVFNAFCSLSKINL